MWFSSWIFLGSLKLINSQQDVAWLVVSTTLKNISQLGLLFPIYKHCSKPPTRDIALIFKLVHHGQPIFKLHLDISRNPIIPIEFLPTSSQGMNEITLTILLIAKHIPSPNNIYILLYTYMYIIILYYIILYYIILYIILYYMIMISYYRILLWYINIYICVYYIMIIFSKSINRH